MATVDCACTLVMSQPSIRLIWPNETGSVALHAITARWAKARSAVERQPPPAVAGAAADLSPLPTTPKLAPLPSEAPPRATAAAVGKCRRLPAEGVIGVIGVIGAARVERAPVAGSEKP